MHTHKLKLIALAASLQGAVGIGDDSLKNAITNDIKQYIHFEAPGLQYVAVSPDRVIFEFAEGWADIQAKRRMSSSTTLMAYSMTKPFTSIAILQLVEHKKVRLDDDVDRYLPNTAYHGHGVTVRQLLNHTSGTPNPIPLRWVHLAAEDASFDESAALAKVLQENPDLRFEPGRKHAYSNIGYWLLGKVVEQITGQPYQAYVRENILNPLQISEQEIAFTIPDESHHANGYLKKYSLLNLVKRIVIDPKFIGSYEGNWLRVNNHFLNGPSFGGLIGSARGFSRFLQDQLSINSVLFGKEIKSLIETRQTNSAGQSIPMTLGWHVGESQGITFLYKEGGGGGFHSEMRIYPRHGIATIVMANSTNFNSTRFLNRIDPAFFESRS